MSEEWNIPGLQNTGNTCYINAVLQALASSITFCKHLDTLAGTITSFNATSEQDHPQPSFIGRVAAAALWAWRFLVHGMCPVCTLIVLSAVLPPSRWHHIIHSTHPAKIPGHPSRVAPASTRTHEAVQHRAHRQQQQHFSAQSSCLHPNQQLCQTLDVNATSSMLHAMRNSL